MDERIAFSNEYLATLTGVLRELPLPALGEAMKVIERAFRERRHIFICGNGGSAATASHMACDLQWTLGRTGKGIKAIALDGLPTITAIANDSSYAEIFAVQIETLADPADVLIVITGSGNSPNIVRAAEVARGKGLTTIGFLGMGGGKVLPLVDVAVVVPSRDYGPIEDVHMVFDHLITAYLKSWVEAGCPER